MRHQHPWMVAAGVSAESGLPTNPKLKKGTAMSNVKKVHPLVDTTEPNLLEQTFALPRFPPSTIFCPMKKAVVLSSLSMVSLIHIIWVLF